MFWRFHFQLPLFLSEIRLFLVARRYKAVREMMTSESVVAMAAPTTRRPAPGIGMPCTVLAGKIISLLSTTLSRHTRADKALGVFMSPVLCIMPLDICRMSMKGTPRQ